MWPWRSDRGRMARFSLMLAPILLALAGVCAFLGATVSAVLLAGAGAAMLLLPGIVARPGAILHVPSRRPGAATPPLDEIQFTVYRPRTIRPGRWYPFLVFAHLADRRPDAPEDRPDPIAQVRAQAELVLGPQAKGFRDTSVDARRPVPQAGEITLVPHVPGLEFNPERHSFRWLEDVHRAEFRLTAPAEMDGRTARGRLSAYLGMILLAEVDLAIQVRSSYQEGTDATPGSAITVRPYRKIFASYSHRDVEVVRQFEKLVESVGDRYLRDIRDLRSGERWRPQLLRLIDEADVFQLFWSSNSMRSKNVRAEWEYALSLGRPEFIRPTYWEEPLPKSPEDNLPPDVLRQLHFHRVNLAPEPAPPPAAPARPSAPPPARSAGRQVNIEPEPAPRAPASPRPFTPAWMGGMLTVLFLCILGPLLLQRASHEGQPEGPIPRSDHGERIRGFPNPPPPSDSEDKEQRKKKDEAPPPERIEGPR